jgi:hypothetical protein
MRSIYLGIVLLLLAGMPVHAANALYYSDGFEGTNYMLPALVAGGHTVTTAADWTDFNTKLASGTYSLAVALCQEMSSEADLAIFTAFLNAGGQAIYADWTRDASFGALFGATYTGNVNLTPATVTGTSFLIGITNPIVLSNPGYGVWSMGLSPTASGTSLGTFPNGDSCMVSSHQGRALLLGFLADTVPVADGQRIFQNDISYVLTSAPPVSVPTLSEWGMIILFGLLGLTGFMVIKRKLGHA